jgi:hypothetical protein
LLNLYLFREKREIRLEYVKIGPGLIEIRKYDVKIGEYLKLVYARVFSKEVREEIEKNGTDKI